MVLQEVLLLVLGQLIEVNVLALAVVLVSILVVPPISPHVLHLPIYPLIIASTYNVLRIAQHTWGRSSSV